jgi:hypothetical protein
VAHNALAWIPHPLEFQQWAVSTPQDGLGIGKVVIKGSWKEDHDVTFKEKSGLQVSS